MSEFQYPPIYYMAGGAVVTCITVFVIRTFLKRRAAQLEAEKRKNYPKDTVILHQIGRSLFTPSLSPFPLKLETYLRMAKIPYQNEHAMVMSAKGKTPFITYNGEDVADSQLSIEYLNKKLDIDVNKHLTNSDRGIALAMRKMVEESTYWALLLERWIFNEDHYRFLKKAIPLPAMVLQGIGASVQKMAHGQGYGRHTKYEVRSIATRDLQALSDFLGTKAFLMGDQPCEEDCAVFGMVAQAKWNAPGTGYSRLLKGEFANLSDYCDRMKERFWPDWEDCTTVGGTKEATK